MPKASRSLPEYPIRLSDRFINDLAEIYSPKVRNDIKKALTNLRCFPEIGSAQVRQSLITLFGPHIRKIPVSTFVIIYRFENNTIDILAMVNARTVR